MASEYCDRKVEDTDLLPVEESIGDNLDSVYLWDKSDGVTSVLRFTHRLADGTVYRHIDSELITRKGLESLLRFRCNETEWVDGLDTSCFVCKSEIHPEEVKPFVSEELYVKYKNAFYKKKYKKD
jgi:hypothetical protein